MLYYLWSIAARRGAARTRSLRRSSAKLRARERLCAFAAQLSARRDEREMRAPSASVSCRHVLDWQSLRHYEYERRDELLDAYGSFVDLIQSDKSAVTVRMRTDSDELQLPFRITLTHISLLVARSVQRLP